MAATYQSVQRCRKSLARRWQNIAFWMSQQHSLSHAVPISSIVLNFECGNYASFIRTARVGTQFTEICEKIMGEELLNLYYKHQNNPTYNLCAQNEYVQWARQDRQSRLRDKVRAILRKQNAKNEQNILLSDYTLGAFTTVFKNDGSNVNIDLEFLAELFANSYQVWRRINDDTNYRNLSIIQITALKFAYNQRVRDHLVVLSSHLYFGLKEAQIELLQSSRLMPYDSSLLAYFAILRARNLQIIKTMTDDPLNTAVRVLSRECPKSNAGHGVRYDVESIFRQLKIITECNIFPRKFSRIANGFKAMMPPIFAQFQPTVACGTSLRLYQEVARNLFIDRIKNSVIARSATPWPVWSISMDAATMSGNLAEKIVPVVVNIFSNSLQRCVQLKMLQQPTNVTRETGNALFGIFQKCTRRLPVLQKYGCSYIATDDGATETRLKKLMRAQNPLISVILDEAHCSNTIWQYSVAAWGSIATKYGTKPLLLWLSKQIKIAIKSNINLDKQFLAHFAVGEEKSYTSAAGTRFGGILDVSRCLINDNLLAKTGKCVNEDDESMQIDACNEETIEADDSDQPANIFAGVFDAGNDDVMQRLYRQMPVLSDASDCEYSEQYLQHRNLSQHQSPNHQRTFNKVRAAYDADKHHTLQQKEKRTVNFEKMALLLLIAQQNNTAHWAMPGIIKSLKERMVQSAYYICSDLGRVMDPLMKLATNTENRSIEMYAMLFGIYAKLKRWRRAKALFLMDTFQQIDVRAAVEKIKKTFNFDFGKKCKPFRQANREFGTLCTSADKLPDSFLCKKCARNYANDNALNLNACTLNEISSLLPPWPHQKTCDYIEQIGRGLNDFNVEFMDVEDAQKTLRSLNMDEFSFYMSGLFRKWQCIDEMVFDDAVCCCAVLSFIVIERAFFKFVERYAGHFAPQILLPVLLCHPIYSHRIAKNYMSIELAVHFTKSCYQWINPRGIWQKGVYPIGYQSGTPMRFVKREIVRRWDLGDRGAAMCHHSAIRAELEEYAKSADGFCALMSEHKLLYDWANANCAVHNDSMINETMNKVLKHAQGQQKTGTIALERIIFHRFNFPRALMTTPLEHYYSNHDPRYKMAAKIAPNCDPEFSDFLPLPTQAEFNKCRREAQLEINNRPKVRRSKDANVAQGNRKTTNEMVNDLMASGQYEDTVIPRIQSTIPDNSSSAMNVDGISGMDVELRSNGSFEGSVLDSEDDDMIDIDAMNDIDGDLRAQMSESVIEPGVVDLNAQSALPSAKESTVLRATKWLLSSDAAKTRLLAVIDPNVDKCSTEWDALIDNQTIGQCIINAVHRFARAAKPKLEMGFQSDQCWQHEMCQWKTDFAARMLVFEDVEAYFLLLRTRGDATNKLYDLQQARFGQTKYEHLDSVLAPLWRVYGNGDVITFRTPKLKHVQLQARDVGVFVCCYFMLYTMMDGRVELNSIIFDADVARNHLAMCLLRHQIETPPHTRIRSANVRELSIKFELICHCKKIARANDDLIKCAGCDELFHRNCVAEDHVLRRGKGKCDRCSDPRSYSIQPLTNYNHSCALNTALQVLMNSKTFCNLYAVRYNTKMKSMKPTPYSSDGTVVEWHIAQLLMSAEDKDLQNLLYVLKTRAGLPMTTLNLDTNDTEFVDYDWLELWQRFVPYLNDVIVDTAFGFSLEEIRECGCGNARESTTKCSVLELNVSQAIGCGSEARRVPMKTVEECIRAHGAETTVNDWTSCPNRPFCTANTAKLRAEIVGTGDCLIVYLLKGDQLSSDVFNERLIECPLQNVQIAEDRWNLIGVVDYLQNEKHWIIKLLRFGEWCIVDDDRIHYIEPAEVVSAKNVVLIFEKRRN